MRVLNHPQELRDTILAEKRAGKKVSYVPTMGYLHEGHLSLMREAKRLGEVLVVSIFVNPAQFNDPEDLLKYPVDTEGDLEKCRSVGVDFVFLPSVSDLYPDGIPKIQMRIPHLMDTLCGLTRPGHFEGILLVLSRLFHFVIPDIAVFGWKDYQQVTIVKEFVRNLAFPIEIVGMDTKREADGLAMSSRNSRLSEKERDAAGLIPRALKLGEKMIREGENSVPYLKEVLSDMIASSSLLKIDYLEFVDPDTLQPLDRVEDKVLLAAAVFSGKVRLIDNLRIEK